MILTCPQCATRYQVDANKFPASGRNVRCAKCGHVWHQLGQMPEPDAETYMREAEARRLAETVSAQTGATAHAPMRPLRPAVDEAEKKAARGSFLGRAALAGRWAPLAPLVLAISP